MNLSLAEIAKACGGELILRGTGETQGTSVCEQVSAETKVSSVVLDSRKITENGVFVATVGERVDGHRFVKDVYDNGVILVVAEKTPEQVEIEHGIPASAWKSYVLVKDTFQALRDMAEYYRSKLTLPIVGITGSVGKTSTKEFIAGVLSEKYNVLKTEGNFNNEVGVPLTLLRIREEHEAAVVEMGISDFGEMHRLSKMVRPNVCVITNIGQCHLENLGDRDGVLKAKTEIFDFMDPEGYVCLNGEDDKLATVTEVNGKKTHFFGFGNNPAEEVYATDVESKGLWGSEAVMHVADERSEGTPTLPEEVVFPVNVPLPGVHMVLNSAAAICVARLLGLSNEQIKEGLSKVKAVGGRTNLIRLENYTLIDDCYNANPVSMRAALDLLAMADTGKVAILGDMFELGTDSDALHGGVGVYAVEKGCDILCCVGENARFMYEAAVKALSGECETSSAERNGADTLTKVHYFADRPALLQALSTDMESLVPTGSTVLMKASHGMHFEEVVNWFQTCKMIDNSVSCK